ncbi:ABC transporter substrate-binding protein [Breznakiella homolactica]|uniref:Extracellular solute-binding protein n=1 Tax=Breznakiella homolactica TaxID=2798577 RepID=A0A7T7XKV0_9SPIR|nr:extracellular solute-binding protein [Breznakiella homolactica]QQO08108.1 extracellular solute-binding protein [Breznakiella homolactica]
MKKSKLLGIFCLSLSFFMAVTACNKSSGGASSGSGTTVELVYWSNWNNTESQGRVMRDAIKEFEQQNPGVKISIVNNGRENRKVVLPALEAGQQVDLMDQNIDFAIRTWKDYLLNMDDYYTRTFPSTGGKALGEALLPMYVDLTRSKDANGSLYGIPYQPNVWGVMYNKDHFAKAGITKAPETWAEFLDVCAKLKAAGFIPITTDDAYADIWFGFHLCRYKGSDWVDGLVNGRNSWNDPQVLQAAKDFEELAAKGYMPSTVSANIWPAGQQEIALGEVTMYLNGSWLPNEVMATAGPDFPWGMFAYPEVPGGADDKGATVVGSQIMCVNKNTKYPDEAMAFAAFISTGKYDQLLSAQTYGIPMDQSNQWPKQLEDAKGIFEGFTKRYPASTTIRNNADKNSLIKEEFVKLIGGKVSAARFIEAMK